MYDMKSTMTNANITVETTNIRICHCPNQVRLVFLLSRTSRKLLHSCITTCSDYNAFELISAMSNTADDEERLARKKAFFAELALLEDDDDEVDSAMQKSMDALKYRALFASQPTASAVKTRDFAVNASPSSMSPLKILGTSATPTPADPLRQAVGRSLLRSHTVSDATALETPFKTPVSLADVVTVVKDTPMRSPAVTPVPQLRTATSMPAVLPTSVAKAASTVASVTGKRKRGDVKTVSLELQVFEGLQFFFIPNDDIAAARRLRIRKAVEYGATRVSTWSTAVTHVIVDKVVTYKDVLKYLKLTEVPVGVRSYTASSAKNLRTMSSWLTRLILQIASLTEPCCPAIRSHT